MLYEVWTSPDRQHVAVGWSLGPLLRDHAEFVTIITAATNEIALTRARSIVDQQSEPPVVSIVDAALAKLHK